jgi:hypothetical protein
VNIVRAGSNPAGCSAERFGPAWLRAAAPAKSLVSSVAGVMVSIVAFQAVDPGSIPGPRTFLHGEGARDNRRMVCLLSLVVEHSLCKRKVGGSIPPVGCCIFCPGCDRTKIIGTTSQRFELWRAEPNRFLIYLLNHSDTMSLVSFQPERIGAEV